MLPRAPLLVQNNDTENRRSSVTSYESDENAVVFRNKPPKTSIWRPSSVVNLIIPSKKSKSYIYKSTPSLGKEDTDSRFCRSSSEASLAKANQWGTIVSVVVVGAKGLPNVPSDGSSHGLYCKIRLGSHTLKSKSVPSSQRPVWQERFQFHRYTNNLLRVSLWGKGKRKSFMGSCVLDLSQLEKERTHEVWRHLDDGYGQVHITVTMCNTHKSETNVSMDKNIQEKHSLLNLRDLKVVGELQVKVLAAKGLSGKPYCLLEVDNQRVRTHAVNALPEICWDKHFVLFAVLKCMFMTLRHLSYDDLFLRGSVAKGIYSNVYDVMSTLDLTVYDNSLVSSLRKDILGQVSIPLLWINDGELHWYALKDRCKRNSAKGNCPRVLLEMSLYWNPIKASLKLFKPKEVKYGKKDPKFDISLVYKNIEFVKDAFVGILALEEGYKQLFEWENREYACIALICWVVFWFYFQPWATPLLLLVPFLYFWIFERNQEKKSFKRGYGIVEHSSESIGKDKPERSLTGRLQELPEMTIITDGVEFAASLAEKMFNLATFKVPFLSYVTMLMLVGASTGLYLIPFNYIMIGFGLYKFSRKHFDPERIPNNDLLDFLSRIPDTEELDKWRELNVPEPTSLITRRNVEGQGNNIQLT